MVTVRKARFEDGSRMVAIWRDAVDASHDFLTRADRAALDEMVSGFLPTAPAWLAVDHDDRPIGFMLLADGHMDALFVDAAVRGMGVGKMLVRHGLALSPTMTTDVNEQNGQAVGFYEQLRFRRVGRSPLDGQGRSYPLLHLVYP